MKAEAENLEEAGKSSIGARALWLALLVVMTLTIWLAAEGLSWLLGI
jgi:hypothetical protein